MRKGILILIVSLAAASCGGSKKAESSEPVAGRVSARLEEVGLATIPQMASVTGTVEARTRTAIAAQVMGVIRQAAFEVGQTVQAGQTLIVLDSQELAAGAAQATARRSEARSGLGEAQAAVDAARDQLELTRTTRGRLAGLYERKSISRQEMDEADSKLKQAEAALAMAQARVEQVQSRIAQAEEGIRTATAQKGYATITAPFAGVISEKLAQVGAMAVPGAPLLAIERAGGFRVALQLDEMQAGGVRMGMPMRLKLDGQEEIEVKVNELVPALDPATRTLTVKADLPSLPGLRTGMFARGSWMIGQREMLSVPAAAVRERGQLQIVFVVESGKARSRMVSLGDPVSGRREILSGLKAGERVIAPLEDSVEDGAAVEVKP